MKSLRNWMFGVALLAGAVGMGATKAQAAEVRAYGHEHVAYEHARPIVRRGWVEGRAYGYAAPGPYYGFRERDRFAHFDGYRRRDFDRRDHFRR